MSIIGCDLHSRYQVVALLEREGGEIVTRRLEHENGEAQAFYAGAAEAVADRDRGDELYAVV